MYTLQNEHLRVSLVKELQFFSCDEDFEDLLSLQVPNIPYGAVSLTHQAAHDIPGLMHFIAGSSHILTPLPIYPCRWQPRFALCFFTSY